ncbi:type VI secretion system contractile sheath large subunit [sulfur-oxidizing endosymbiont of Gigantopelta aegis]|uniref:type VI secretion system contractile sheath large subunit n=1 Tax=sulfur-oxidizing endosymbiont of Gigantopelta aegis TaxID=2794934 RepID=UPI0018DBA16D|nr:type VI secretion system contractile sheath large subunit [sulfur-oxidizing endosymbiont of Gigantopelta aegis]
MVEEQQSESASLLDSIVSQTKLKPADEGYDVQRKGVSAFIAELIKPQNKEERVNKNLVDKMIAELDQQMSKQLDQIMHHREFQSLESSWRGLKLLIDRTDFRENIKVELLSVSKADLLDDFEDAPEVIKSGLYKQVYTSEFGQFGGEPVGVMISNYQLSPSTPDVKLMQHVSNVAAMAHAPFIASAGPQFFDLDDFEGLPNLKDLKSIFEGPKYAKWNSFRESEDSRYVGLTMPRFLLRPPYDSEENPVKVFNYEENVSNDHEDYLWGNTSFTLGTRLTDSFAKFRWCPNIIGPQSGGSVDDLPLHHFESMGDIETKIPTEILISDRKEFELAEEGFIPLTMRKGTDNAAFFSANSTQKNKRFANNAEGKAAETNYKLGSQLPYMFIINRLAHYLKVIQRENLGSWKERSDLERELNTWIRQFVADQENPAEEVRSRRPLRSAKVEVTEVEGEPGWYRAALHVKPHFKYMGSDFTLSLVGKLDKS